MSSAPAIPILLYHGVSASAAPGLQPWVMAPETFEAHLDLLTERGCHTLTVSALVQAIAAGDELPERTVVVTFDDGWADFATEAWPRLRERSLAATLYVVSSAVGGRAEWVADLGEPCPSMLTWDELRRLEEEGCEIGAHSRTHPELDTLPRADLDREVSLSRGELSRHLARPVRSFAYPHGYHDRRVRDAVQAAGFHSACAVREGLSSRDDDPFALARVTLLHHHGVDHLARVLDGQDLPVAPFPERLPTKGWRTYRRARRLVASR